MRMPAAHHVLRLLGALFALAGLLAWGGLAWKAVAAIDDVNPQGEEGARLLTWGLTGTLLMIVGMVLFHLAADAAEKDEEEPPH